MFIDELDAVGGKRDEGWREQQHPPNHQPAAERDRRFRGDEGVLVIAATNLKDSLDPALIRAGRFDLEVKSDCAEAA